MRLLVAICVAFWLSAGSPAQAGAWLREKGSGFTSLSFGLNRFEEGSQSLYFEYGLSEKMTIGLDVTTSTQRSDFRDGQGHIFLRRQLWANDGPHKLAYEIGIGGTIRDDAVLPTFKSGLSWGRGVQLYDRNGWVNVNAAFIYEPSLGEHITKMDATFGLELGQRTSGLVELSLFHQHGDTYQAVEPSLLIRPKDSRFNFKVGAKIPFDDQDKSSLRLAVWHSF
ncbi:MAG: hypothetical protein ABJL67_22730 [Sulfitobacter sp.]